MWCTNVAALWHRPARTPYNGSDESWDGMTGCAEDWRIPLAYRHQAELRHFEEDTARVCRQL